MIILENQNEIWRKTGKVDEEIFQRLDSMALENAYDDEDDEGFGDEFHTVGAAEFLKFKYMSAYIQKI